MKNLHHISQNKQNLEEITYSEKAGLYENYNVPDGFFDFNDSDDRRSFTAFTAVSSNPAPQFSAEEAMVIAISG